MFSDHWKSLLAWGAVIVFMVSIQMYVYPSVASSGDAAQQLLDTFPESIRKIFRIEDYASGPGFLSVELFSMMIPLVMIGVGLTWGANATAEEEEDGTADILYALPLSRTSILMSKVLAILTALLLLSVAAFIQIVALRGFASLTVDTVNLAIACFMQFLLGVFFSAIGFLCGALTGKKSLSLGIGAGFAILAFLFYSLAPMVDTFEFTNPINPFQWTVGENALIEGINFLSAAKLALSSVAVYLMAIFTFSKREMRS